MFANFTKIAWRILARRPAFSAINILGLSLGFTGFLFILLFIDGELSHDRHHQNRDRIVQVGTTIVQKGVQADYALVSRAVGEYIRDKYSDIQSQTLIQKWKPTIKLEDKYINSEDFVFAEPDFVDLFTMEVLQGDLRQTLTEPYHIALTAEAVQRFFPDVDPLGKLLIVNDTTNLVVSAVVKTPPKNSTLQFDVMVSYATQRIFVPRVDDWTWMNNYLYLLPKDNTEVSEIDARFEPLVMQNFGEPLRGTGMNVTLDVIPFTDVYLHSNKQAEFSPSGDIRYVYTFSAIGLFILILAIINYVNLSTARSAERAKEVGIRKLCGSQRWSITEQFLWETLAISLIAMSFSWVIVLLLLDSFNVLSGRSLEVMDLVSPFFISVSIAIVLASSLAAGIYPGFLLAAFRPIATLKGDFKTSSKGQWLRKSLIIGQFTISITLVIASLVAYRQLQFMQEKSLGFNKEEVIVVDGSSVLRKEFLQQYRAFRDECLSESGISQASVSSSVPGRGTPYLVTYPEGLAEGETCMMWVLSADEGLLPTLQIELVAGRNFSREYSSDAFNAVLINESAAKNAGWKSPAEALGKRISIGGKPNQVVGVFRDFHYFSLKRKLEPMLINMQPGGLDMLSFRVQTTDIASTLARLEAKWHRHYPAYSFQYFFLDDDFAKQYQAETKELTIFRIFTIVAIVIALVGLIGLTSYSASQRTREIGIRKVLGASSSQIVFLLSGEVLVLVGASVVMASFGSAWLTAKWASNFPYQAPFAPGLFFIAAGFAVTSAWITTTTVLVRTSLRNPVETLRQD